MRVIGLDLSLRATGIAVKSGDADMCWDTFAAKGTGLERLDAIRQWVSDFMHGGSQTCVVLEGLSYASAALGHRLGHSELVGLHYLVRHRLWRAEVCCVIVAPMQLKKFVTARGNAEKAMVLREVYRRFGALVSNDNEADAVVLAYIGLALTGQWKPQIAAQRDVLEKVRLANREALDNIEVNPSHEEAARH